MKFTSVELGGQVGATLNLDFEHSTSKEIFHKAEGWEKLVRLLTVVFGLFGLLLLFISLHSFVSRRTWIRDGMIHQRAHLFGIPWSRNCPARSAIGVNMSDSTSSGGRTWYDIVIERNAASRFAGKAHTGLFGRITVAIAVPNRREAEAIVERLRKELGLKADADGLADQ